MSYWDVHPINVKEWEGGRGDSSSIHSSDCQRRYDMRHEMPTQRAPFCIGAPMATKGMLSQHFVTHVVPPLSDCILGTFSSLWFSLHCYCEVSDMCHE